MSDQSNGSRRTLDDWLRAAYAGPAAGCPPPEAFLEAEAAGLSPEARRALDEHAARCPACAAERDLARLFDAAPEEADVRPGDLDFVVSRLAGTAPAAEPNVVPFPGPRRIEAPRAEGAHAHAPQSRWNRRALLRFAAAAVLVLAAGLGYRAFQPPGPDLPDPEIGVMRGGEVEAVAPVGEVAEMPAELRWVLLDRAASYRVRITAVDGSVLWEDTVSAPPARLPADVAGRLHRAVVYTWTIEALDPGGARFAASEPVQFRVKPEPEGQ